MSVLLPIPVAREVGAGTLSADQPKSINQSILKGRVERIFFFALFKLPLFSEYEMVFIIA